MKPTLANPRAYFARKIRGNFRKVATRLTRNNIIFANRKSPGCYLDVGCDVNTDPDFCCLDYQWQPGIDVCWDVTRGLPFDTGYIGGIYTEHMLEHIDFANGCALLKEFRRVLRPGGTARIIVPDGELYLSEYAKHLNGQKTAMPYAAEDAANFAISTPIVSINRAFREAGHQFIWDYETLRQALLMAGFTTVTHQSFGKGADPKLLRDMQARAYESLYVEAA